MPIPPNEEQIINSVLTGDVSKLGAPRIPFFLGSYKSTGIDIRLAIEGENFNLFNVDFWKMIRLGLNPNSITITPTLRIAEARTGSGRVYYNWVNEKGSAIEAYEVSLSGETGNLLPGNSESRRKLWFWMKLRELTLEPREVSTVQPQTQKGGEFAGSGSVAGVTEKRVNDQFMLIRTIGIPITMLLIGFFKTPIVFNESSESQYNHSWSCTFVVTDMFPRYEDLSRFTSFSVLPELIGEFT